MKRRAPELTLEADDHSRRRVFFVFGFVFFAPSFSPPPPPPPAWVKR